MGKDLFDRRNESGGFGFCDAAGAAPRRDASVEQGFARVDISDPYDDLRIHEQLLDGDSALARGLIQILGIEGSAQGFGRQFLEQRMLMRVGRRPMQTAETSRIMKAQQPIAIEV